MAEKASERDHRLEKTANVLLGKGDGTFQPALSDALGTRLISVAVGDLTGGGSAGQAGRKVRRECACEA